MGKRGPPPKPTALKKLEGTFRPDRATTNEVQAPPAAPLRPKLPRAAAEKWDEIVPLLVERGTLSLEDGAILEGYCRSYDMWVRYQSDAEKKPIVKTPFGPKVNPAAGEARKWETRLTAMGDRLGLNAAARSRVSAPEKPKQEDTTEDFLFGPPRLVKGGAGGE
jgi:P27 family predicted phage terminase small subunit